MSLLFPLPVILCLLVEPLLCETGRLRPKEKKGLERGHSASQGGLGPPSAPALPLNLLSQGSSPSGKGQAGGRTEGVMALPGPAAVRSL